MEIFVSRDGGDLPVAYPTIFKELESTVIYSTVSIRGSLFSEAILLNDLPLLDLMPTFYECMSELSYKPLKCTRG